MASKNEGPITFLPFGSAVGYEVHVGPNLFDRRVALWIHEHAPQDAPHELYGFKQREERDLFRRLLDIKGVGPKVAMRVVATFTPEARLNMTGFFDRLTKIRGVGATLAQRICEAMQ